MTSKTERYGRILFLKGLPASGKSTFAKKLVIDNAPNWVRVNKDDIRDQIFAGKWSREREKTVLSIEWTMVSCALFDGKNVVVDSTNFSPKHEERFRDLARTYGGKFEVKFFDVPVNECIARDASREKPVGEKVIRQMFDQYIRPTLPKQDESLPPCYVFDMDGTLAKMNGRGPFEYNLVGRDLVNEPVADLVNPLRSLGNEIIVLSGRDGSCFDLTRDWLVRNFIHFDQLIMRTAGDNRKDSIIKRELYEKFIKGKFFVKGWFDDRNQVVEMVRDELNLPCFQVDWGNF